jgi:anti-anti-sigma factor
MIMASKLEFNIEENQGIVKINLTGRLDATNAGGLMEELRKFQGQDISEIAYLAGGLEYIASAGLRVIIFSKQKIGMKAKVFLIGAQEPVVEVVKMSGLDNFLIIQDSYDK